MSSTYGTAVASGSAVGVRQTFDATAGLQDVIHGHFQPGSQVPEKMKNHVSGNRASHKCVSRNHESQNQVSGEFDSVMHNKPKLRISKENWRAGPDHYSKLLTGT